MAEPSPTVQISENVEAHLIEARAAMMQGEYETAQTQLEALYERGARGVEVMVELSTCALRQGDVARAAPYLSRAAALEAGHPRVLCNRGLEAALGGHLDDARELFCASLEAEPAGAEAYKWRGICFRELGDLEHALPDLDRAAATLTTDSMLFVHRGMVYASLGDDTRALEDFERASALPLGSALAHRQAARLLAKAGRSDEAEAHYDAAIELDYASVEAWLGLATIFAVRADWSEALRCIATVLALAPDDPAVHIRVAEAFLELAMPEKAMAYLAGPQKDVGQEHEVLFLRAKAYFLLSRWSACVASCDQVLAQASDHAMAYLYRGLARFESGDGHSEEAAADIEAAHRLAPNHPMSLLGVAERALRGGDRERACLSLAAALSLDPRLAERVKASRLLAPLAEEEAVAHALQEARVAVRERASHRRV